VRADAQASRPAVLLAQMQPPADLLAEFNDWYDTEHVPERARMPGFLSSVRLVCIGGWPACAALYDLEHAGVLDQQPYRSISGPNASAWSRRLLPRMVGYARLLLEQASDDRAPLTPEQCGLAILSFAGDACEQAARGAAVLVKGIVSGRHRVFRRLESQAPETFVIFDAPALELIPQWSPQELSDAFGGLTAQLRRIWRYERYWRQAP
jgi:hypothetical protein